MPAQDKLTSRYDQATELFDTNRAQCIDVSRVVLACPDLPWHLRLKTLLLLAEAVDDWSETEVHNSCPSMSVSK